MAMRFVVKQDRGGSYRFHLTSPDGHVLASSHAYDSKSEALDGIDTVRRDASEADVDDQSHHSS